MGLAPPDLPEAPAFANSTRAVMRRHSALVLEQLKDVDGLREAEQLLKVASLLARRLQLLIENAPRACFLPNNVAPGGVGDLVAELLHRPTGTQRPQRGPGPGARDVWRCE